MARQTKGGKYFDPDLESLETEADAFACQHGINSKRIRRVFKRIAQDYCGKSSMAGSKVKDVLDNALRYLPIEETLALFEREDLNKLAERVTLMDYLTDDITPLLNLKDLECVTKSYLSYLDRNRENLIKIGRPRTGFRLSWPPNSYWLDWYLTNLRKHLEDLIIIHVRDLIYTLRSIEYIPQNTGNRAFDQLPLGVSAAAIGFARPPIVNFYVRGFKIPEGGNVEGVVIYCRLVKCRPPFKHSKLRI